MLKSFVRRFSCFFCAAICIFSLSVPCLAVEMTQTVQGMRMTYIQTAQCTLETGNGDANATARVTGSSGVDKCKIVLEIQKQQESHWVTIDTQTVEENGYRASAYSSVKAEQGASYRAKATVTVWSNGATESKTITSN